jgi:hypothetical protein
MIGLIKPVAMLEYLKVMVKLFKTRLYFSEQF